jgi:hypothetical protein
MSSADSIRAVLAAAHRAGLPARYELSSPSEATSWRHQVYRLRQKSSEHGLHNIRLIITEEEPSVVHILPLLMGRLTNAEGEEVSIAPVVHEPDGGASLTEPRLTPEQTAANALAESLGINLGEE